MKLSKNIMMLVPVFVGSLALKACFQETIDYTSPNQRAQTSGGSAVPEKGSDDVKDADKADDATPTENVPGFKFAFDASADASVTSYKVFIVPAGSVPLQVKTFAMADLVVDGTLVTGDITSDEVKKAIGTTVLLATDYCFTITAVNAVGNSRHSSRICP